MSASSSRSTASPASPASPGSRWGALLGAALAPVALCATWFAGRPGWAHAHAWLDWVALALCLGLGACWLLRALRGQGLLVVAVVTGVYLSAMAPGLMAVGWFVLCAGGDCL